MRVLEVMNKLEVIYKKYGDIDVETTHYPHICRTDRECSVLVHDVILEKMFGGKRKVAVIK